MASSKPTIVIVPGAWHPPSFYTTFTTALEKAGYNASVAGLPSLNSQTAESETCAKDTDTVRQAISSLVEGDEKEVVVLCHSYGGIPGGGAPRGLSKAARSKTGQEGGVIGLVYSSAFTVPENATLLQIMGGKHAPYLVPDVPSKGLSGLQGARDVFYNDIDDEKAAKIVDSLQPHAMNVFETDAPHPTWADEDFKGNLAFIRCTKDQALPPFLQDKFIESSGVDWIVRDIESSHSPFISQTDKLVGLLDEVIPQFGQR